MTDWRKDRKKDWQTEGKQPDRKESLTVEGQTYQLKDKQTDGTTDRKKSDRQTYWQKDRHTYKQRVEREGGRIFASLYTIIKNKMGNIS